jgi:chromosome segregation ATPase
MRKFFVVMIFVVLMVLSSCVALAADIKDVRQDHWAYEGIKYLVDKGYLQLYDDNTFRGEESVNRYTLATTLTRILKDLSLEDVDIAQGDLELLRKLTVEFREELVALSLRSSEVEDAFSELEKSIKVVWEDIALMTESADTFQQNTAETMEALRTELETIRNEAQSIRAETLSLRSDLDGLASDILTNQSYVVSVKSEVETMKNTLASIQNDIGTSEEKVFTIQQSLTKIDNDLDILDASLANSIRRESELRNQLTELNKNFDEYKKVTEKQISDLRLYVIIGAILGLIIR